MLTQLPARPALLLTLFALCGLGGCPGAKDTGAEDSRAEDSRAEDSRAEDTSAPDTSAADTSAEDTGPDDSSAEEPCEEEEEVCDGLDNDCDGVVDGPGVEQTWYTDEDRDGYGDESTAVYGCFPDRPHLVGVAGDCDDDNRHVYEGHAEECDGLDNDCDGLVPSDEVDGDGDGELICAGDCDDAEPMALSGFLEICDDGIDNDCEGTIDEDCSDVSECDALVSSSSGSIQDAIDAASTGDIICVGPGTYSEHLDFGGAEVSVIGMLGPDHTQVPRATFDAAEGPATLLKGFTLHGAGAENGGCMDIEGASPTLEDLVVEGCSAEYGGGIYVEDGSPTLTNVVVQDNECDYSLGSSSYGWGGGMALIDADVLGDNLIVQDNYAVSTGGGILVDGGTLTLLHAVLRGNRIYATPDGSSNGGGGLIARSATVNIQDALVVGNSAGALIGGGLRLIRSRLTAMNVVIADNDAGPPGGGLALDDSGARLMNVVISGNATDEDWGGGLFAEGSSTATVTNSDLWGNDPDDIYGVTDPTGTDGNLSEDPAFLDETYHLSSTSTLIDAGDEDLLDPDGGRSDIGAWGGPEADGWDLDGDGFSSWWLPGAYDATTSPDLDCEDEDASVYPGGGC